MLHIWCDALYILVSVPPELKVPFGSWAAKLAVRASILEAPVTEKALYVRSYLNIAIVHYKSEKKLKYAPTPNYVNKVTISHIAALVFRTPPLPSRDHFDH